jgi:hypothetical protein
MSSLRWIVRWLGIFGFKSHPLRLYFYIPLPIDSFSIFRIAQIPAYPLTHVGMTCAAGRNDMDSGALTWEANWNNMGS